MVFFTYDIKNLKVWLGQVSEVLKSFNPYVIPHM